MLKVISALILVAQVLFPTAPPGVDRTDAFARASGNRKPVAVKIGQALFATQWPAQVMNVYADGIAGHDVAGLHISGVHFHRALTREQFIDEIAGLVSRTFKVAPVEEVDVWASVPLGVGRGVVVAGDLAKPTFRVVFTLSARREESADSLVRRMRQGSGVFWDQDWERKVFNSIAAPTGSNHVNSSI
ncbi:MAG TPA: hypothetical protein VJP85_01735 [Candidatus Baltobacteraceae bacterium]|nr:hypothetical protein [Candidatus Baltobacteraceae bacterium]